jgi:hypothetical protein
MWCKCDMRAHDCGVIDMIKDDSLPSESDVLTVMCGASRTPA